MRVNVEISLRVFRQILILENQLESLEEVNQSVEFEDAKQLERLEHVTRDLLEDLLLEEVEFPSQGQVLQRLDVFPKPRVRPAQVLVHQFGEYKRVFFVFCTLCEVVQRNVVLVAEELEGLEDARSVVPKTQQGLFFRKAVFHEALDEVEQVGQFPTRLLPVLHVTLVSLPCTRRRRETLCSRSRRSLFF